MLHPVHCLSTTSPAVWTEMYCVCYRVLLRGTTENTAQHQQSDCRALWGWERRRRRTTTTTRERKKRRWRRRTRERKKMNRRRRRRRR